MYTNRNSHGGMMCLSQGKLPSSTSQQEKPKPHKKSPRQGAISFGSVFFDAYQRK
jgi:hypothetical protein